MWAGQEKLLKRRDRRELRCGVPNQKAQTKKGQGGDKPGAGRANKKIERKRVEQKSILFAEELN
jgi:hypothetical protein